MSEITKEYVVCVKEEDQHTDVSVLTRCDICHHGVWVMPFNLLRIPICLSCAKELSDAKWIVNKENMDAAIAEIKKRSHNANTNG